MNINITESTFFTAHNNKTVLNGIVTKIIELPTTIKGKRAPHLIRSLI